MAISLILLATLLSSFSPLTVSSSSDSLKTYIVHLESPSSSFNSFLERQNWYKSFLPSGLTNSRIIYSYKEIIHGFAVRLSEAELSEIETKVGFLHAYPDKIYTIKTTHTPKFLGLSREGPGFWTESNYGKGVIIGVLDTGISPNHPSFKDTGMPPPPLKWKGKCEFNLTDCNNKLIGARTFRHGLDAMQGSNSSTSEGPYDYNGHGTHTASTAAGTFVEGANINGLANGTASGVAPYAHLAMYKVCGNNGGCADSDLLAGFDSAVQDGVDVISVSIGGFNPVLYEDSIAIGSFSAVEKGIFVSCAGGNSGPFNYTVDNGAPWILTVGASSVDRALRSVIKVEKYRTDFYGESSYQPGNFTSIVVPIVFPGASGGYEAAYCMPGSLDEIDVRGKIVICDLYIVKVQIDVVKDAGGAGIILVDDIYDGASTFDYPIKIPGSFVNFTNGIVLKGLAITGTNPKASIIFKGTVLETPLAPIVAYFSSRGPNYVDPYILKPDIIGPGLNILAAWPFLVGPSSPGNYFNMISGTSMATPHLSGIATLLKSMHSTWSPAMIKSAIMTTAYLIGNDGKPIVDQSLKPANFFSIGSGHVNPSKASNPGLVYDISTNDYINYLCGLNYSNAQVSAVLRRNVTCLGVPKTSSVDLNLPSFTLQLNKTNNYIVNTKRTVINVGVPISKYTVKIAINDQVEVEVKPNTLYFTSVNETAEYSVVFRSSGLAVKKVYHGYLTWISSDGSTTVGSPLVIAVGNFF